MSLVSSLANNEDLCDNIPEMQIGQQVPILQMQSVLVKTIRCSLESFAVAVNMSEDDLQEHVLVRDDDRP